MTSGAPLKAGQCGRRGPFGSPLMTKLAQYEDIVSAALRSCAVQGESTASRQCPRTDRKSTRLNSSHQIISYAVFCLKKKSAEPSRTEPLDGRIAASNS